MTRRRAFPEKVGEVDRGGFFSPRNLLFLRNRAGERNLPSCRAVREDPRASFRRPLHCLGHLVRPHFREGPEIPALDGCSAAFAEALRQAQAR